MTGAEMAEIAQLGRTVEQVLAKYWERPARAAAADLDALWSAAAEYGWFELEGSLPAALAVVRAAGRFACPLPVMDAFVAGEVLADRPDLTVAIGADAVRVALAEADDSATVGAGLSHVLELPSGAGEAVLRPVLTAEPVMGLAAPPWYRVVLDEPEATVRLTAEASDRMRTLRRLGIAAHAVAAVEHSHELALAHAKTRRQFGRLVGGYGGVQRRLVDARMELACADLLITEAGRLDRGVPDAQWRLAAELAVAHARRVVPQGQLAAHQTLAAVGYYEEHDAPWLFRSAFADLARLPADSAIADLLLAGAELPDVPLSPAAEATRNAFRAFLTSRGPVREASVDTADDPATVAAMAAEGWLTLGWPAESGGRAAAPDEQAAVQQEVFRRRIPVTGALAAAATVGAALVRHGTPEQRAEILPRIARGELAVAVGYSEPEAGSDLAALRTRAVRDGDGWLINGQKAWTSDGHLAEYLWLAVRTNPDATPPHAGITLFLVPADTPGIRFRPDIALSGQVACTVFLDDVRVPDSARVGPVDGGWAVLSDVLTSERAVLCGIAATAHRQLDDLVAALAGQDPGEAARFRLAELAARVQAVRLLAADVFRPAEATQATSGDGTADRGTRRPVSASAATGASAVKVLGSELAADLAVAALELLGPRAARVSPLESALRLAPGSATAGGTNDVHRGLIARGLGLPA